MKTSVEREDDRLRRWRSFSEYELLALAYALEHASPPACNELADQASYALHIMRDLEPDDPFPL